MCVWTIYRQGKDFTINTGCGELLTPGDVVPETATYCPVCGEEVSKTTIDGSTGSRVRVTTTEADDKTFVSLNFGPFELFISVVDVPGNVNMRSILVSKMWYESADTDHKPETLTAFQYRKAN